MAGCPSGQTERSVKPSASPSQVRILDLPPPTNLVLAKMSLYYVRMENWIIRGREILEEDLGPGWDERAMELLRGEL